MNAPASAKLVLIVEDNPDNRTLAAKVLRRAGYATDEVDRAEGITERVRQRRPHLVLMDIELPGQSGYEAVLELRSDPATAAVPVIALTAYAMDDDRQRCLHAGCNDYLSKPLDIDLLLETVRKHIA